jgi:hypothetical protein
MITSGQVSGMFAQQNQMFAGNAQYSQQISQGMPGMYSGMFGMPMGGPQGFGYQGGAPMGYDVSSRMAGGVVAGMGGAAQFGLAAGSIAAGMGMGGPMRYALDPFAGGGAMYRLGGRMGLGMGGRLAMGAVGMAPAAAALGFASHAIGSAVTGAQEQASIDRVLGQQNFINPSSGGRGFTRQQSMAIGNMVRQMDQLPELMTSMGEMTRIMDRMGQMGLMNNVTSVKEFGTKFKQTLGVLREMSKVIGSTMEEALPLFGEIRRSGFYSNTDILKNAMQRQIVGGISGMNQGQVGALAAAGSQMGFATGGSRRTGAQHALRVAGQLGMANQMGVLGNDQIMELTGMEGAEGIQALSNQLTQAGYRMSRGALGTAMSIAMAEQDGGKFTGKMDAKLIERFRRGEVSKSEMLRMAHQKTSSRGEKMSYVANQGKLRSEMAGQMGVEGQMSMLQMILGERGFENPDALRIVSQGFGLDEREAELLVDLGKKMPDINIQMRQQGRGEARRIAQEGFMKSNTSWDAIKAKTGKKFESVFTEPFKQFGADVRNIVAETVDSFVEDITGQYKVEVSKGMSSLIRGAGSDLGGARQRLRGMLTGQAGAALSGAIGRGGDMTPGRIGSFTNWMSGNVTAGENLAASMNLTMAGRGGLETMETDNYSRISGMRDRGYTALSRDKALFGRDDWTLASRSGMAAHARRLESLAYGTNQSAGIFNNVDPAMLAQAGRELASVRAFSTNLYGEGGQDLIGGIMGEMGAMGKRRGGETAFSKLASQYGGAEILSAASRGIGGLTGQEKEALLKMAGAARYTPDSMQDLAKSQKAFEQGGLIDIFGREGAEAFKELAGERMGTEGFEILGSMTSRGLRTKNQSTAYTYSEGRAKMTGYRNETVADMGEAAAVFQKVTGGPATIERVTEYLRDRAVHAAGGGKLSGDEMAIIESQKSAYEGVFNQVMMSQIKDKGVSGRSDWTEQEKAYLSKMGYGDPASFTPEEAKKWEDMMKTLGGAKMNEHQRGELNKYLSGKGAMSFGVVAQRMQEQGKSIESRANALSASGIKLGEKGNALLGRIKGLGGRLQGTTTNQGLADALAPVKGNSAFQEMGSIAYDLTNLKDSNAVDALLATSDDLAAAYSRAQYVKRGGKTGRRGFNDYFDSNALIKEGRGEEIASVRERFFTGKGGTLGKGKEKEFAEFLAGDEGGKLLTASGAEQRSKYANQAEIAQSMEKFGQSVASLAEIVQTMKDGKQTGGGGTK